MPRKYYTQDSEKIVAVNTTLSLADVRNRGPIVVTTDGVTVTLPAPQRDIWKYEVPIFNYSSGYVSVECIGYIAGSNNSFTLAPKESATLVCTKVDAGTTYRWIVNDANKFEDDWAAWDPTITYTTGTPTGLTKSLRYKLYKGVCFYDVSIVATDGKGCTQIAIPLPPETGYSYIAGLGEIPAMQSEQLVDTTQSAPSAYVDAGNATIASRVLTTHNFSAATSGKALNFRASGWFEYDGSFSAWTTTVVAGTADWAAPARVSRYKVIDGLVFCYHHGTSADGKNCSSLTFTPPLAPRDINLLIPFAAIAKIDTTWTNQTNVRLDMNDATVTNRLVGFETELTFTDAKAAQLSWCGVYPHDKDIAYTPTLSITGGPVVPVGKVGRYKVIGAGVCWYASYFTGTDGLGSTQVTAVPPLAPRYAARHIMVNSQEKVNTTWTNTLAYLNADEAVPASRAILNYDFSTMTSGKAVALRQCGLYEVG